MILAAILIACMMFAFTSCDGTNTGDTSKTKSTHKVGDADFGNSDDDTVVNEGGVSATKKIPPSAERLFQMTVSTAATVSMFTSSAICSPVRRTLTRFATSGRILWIPT